MPVPGQRPVRLRRVKAVICTEEGVEGGLDLSATCHEDSLDDLDIGVGKGLNQCVLGLGLWTERPRGLGRGCFIVLLGEADLGPWRRTLRGLGWCDGPGLLWLVIKVQLSGCRRRFCARFLFTSISPCFVL